MSTTADAGRLQRIMDQYRCNADDAQLYLDLREEGHTGYEAAVMAGLRDPDEVTHD